METDYSKHTYFRWKVKWRLEHLGALGTMGEIAPLIFTQNGRKKQTTWDHNFLVSMAVSLEAFHEISRYLYVNSRVIWFSDLLDLWVIKIKRPIILCGRSTSRITWTERETQIKQRKVCLFYSQSNKILWLSNTADTFGWKIHEVRKSLWTNICE